MKMTRQTTFANTAIVGNITYRDVGTFGITIGIGALLFMTPVFKWNIPAIVAYIAFASIVVGQTPTKRAMLWNLYGLLFKKPVRMVVSNLATTTTLGHGIREVVHEDDLEVPASKTYSGHYLLVYTITSGLNQWSPAEDYQKQATSVKNLLNTFEGGESLTIVTKADADTGMLRLEDALHKEEAGHLDGDDLQRLADNRRDLLHRVATHDVGRSVQQYAILRVKPKNINRCVKALKKASRILRPATNPGDVLLSTMGFESGTEQDD